MRTDSPVIEEAAKSIYEAVADFPTWETLSTLQKSKYIAAVIAVIPSLQQRLGYAHGEILDKCELIIHRHASKRDGTKEALEMFVNEINRDRHFW